VVDLQDVLFSKERGLDILELEPATDLELLAEQIDLAEQL